VKDAKLGAGKASVTINVFEAGPNIEMPVAKFTIDPDPPQGEAPFEVSVDGSQSRDLQGPIVSYTWEWGDGTPETTGVRATHMYQRSGTFKLRLTVLDTDNNSHSRTRTVLVTGEGEGGEPKPPENAPPVAVINVDVERGPAPLTVRFNGGSSTDADGDPLTYAWDFGDGATATGREVVHTYEQQGTYFARLTVEDGNGGRSVRTQRIVVEPPLFNRAPAAFIASGRRTGTAPLSLTFRSASVDPDGDPLSYTWEFWQVNEDGRERVGEDTSGAEVTFQFADPARYEVILTVTDPAGVSDTTPPEIVTVTARIPGGNENDNDGGEEPEPPPPAPNRFCAFGMLSGLVGTLLGLASMLAARRRFRF
jgi:PKD repeat protein